MIKDSNSGAVWRRWIKASYAVGVLALVTACSGGGGGGGGSSPKPHFEKTTFDNLPAVRDNITGNVWAVQLWPVGLNSVTPKAEALLAVADLPDAVRQEYFPFVNGNVIKASNPVPDSVWAVDFGKQSLGRMSNEATADATLKTWVLLQQGSLPTTSFLNLSNGTVTQGSSLQWSLCSEGATYDSNQRKCTGTPQLYSLTEANARASKATWGGRTGWRLPTKLELQSLLLLSNAVSNQPMLVEPFASADALKPTQPLEYLTSTVYTQNDLLWVVNFAGSGDIGGVEAINKVAVAYVRLVRDL